MIAALIRWSIGNRVLVLLATAAIAAAGSRGSISARGAAPASGCSPAAARPPRVTLSSNCSMVYLLY